MEPNCLSKGKISLNFRSVRPDKRFRLALGSFVEEYNNKVQVDTMADSIIVHFYRFKVNEKIDYTHSYKTVI
jgi:hypothetical protein